MEEPAPSWKLKPRKAERGEGDSRAGSQQHVHMDFKVGNSLFQTTFVLIQLVSIDWKLRCNQPDNDSSTGSVAPENGQVLK